MIVKAQAMLLVGAIKYVAPMSFGLGRPKVWQTKYTLPHSPGPNALPRFSPTGLLLYDINWKYSPANDLNAKFIRALVQSVEQIDVSLLLLHSNISPLI